MISIACNFNYFIYLDINVYKNNSNDDVDTTIRELKGGFVEQRGGRRRVGDDAPKQLLNSLFSPPPQKKIYYQ